MLLENKSRSERMRKGGAITANTLTYFTLRAVVLRRGVGVGGHRQLLRLCHLEPACLVKKLKDGADCCRAEGEASAGGNYRGCRVGQDVPAPQQAGVSVTNYIPVRQKSHKTLFNTD